MVSDQEIASCVETLLRQQSSDPANAGASVSLTGVVQQVEAKLGLDLSHKTSFIRDQIDLLLGPPRAPPPQAAAAVPPAHFIFQAPHQILFQPFPQMGAGAGVGGGGNVNVNVPVSSPFAQFGAHQELAFRYPAPVQMGPAGAGGVGVVAVAPPQQYGHGPVAPGSRPIGSALDNKESAPPVAKRRGGPGGLSKICGVSPELQAIVGEPAMPRTQIVKQLWAYIRKNNLQDPNNKRKIICNDELRLVFETDCTDMFKMNKLLAKHILPLDETKDMSPAFKKLKAEDGGTATEPAVGEQVAVVSATEQPSVISASNQAAVISASEQPAVISTSEQSVGDYTSEQVMVISASLAMFLGTDEKEMLQSEALKRVFDYIKENQLEDPTSTTIRCDSRLQQLFGCETLPTLVIPEMLACHLYQKS